MRFVFAILMGFVLQVWAQEESFLRGIVLIKNPNQLLNTNALEEVEGVDASQVFLPGHFVDFEEEMSPFLCLDSTEGYPSQWSSAVIREIKQKIYRYYQNQGYPLVLVSVPTQNPSSHVLQVAVQESRLDKVDVQGNRWLKAPKIERYLSLKQGEPISQRSLSRDIDFMNRNPFRHVDVIYSPGEKENTTDLTLQVYDQKPYHFYTGMDNTGIASTGTNRVFAGFSLDQLFGIDQTFFYQYTTGLEVQHFHANTFQYSIFLPAKQILDLYGGFSIVRANIAFPNRDNKGTNIQASFRHHMPFLPWRFYSHELIWGFDLKNTNNTMEFVEFFATVGQTVNMSQWTLGYKGKYEQGQKLLEGGIKVVFSPMQWLPDQSRADFESLRPQADNRWVYLNANFKAVQPLPYNFSFVFSGEALWTQQVILPSEQLGIGGYGSVRGYDERQYNADKGMWGSAELYFPPFSIFRSRQPNQDRMRFLLFLDGGGGLDNVEIYGIKKQNFLVGAGPGARYSFGRYLNARLDWGIKLHHQEAFKGGWSMLHFSFTGSY